MEGLEPRRPKIAPHFQLASLAIVGRALTTWLLFGLCLFSLHVSWADGQDAFKQGNAAYSAAKFNDAVTDYELAKTSGLNHWMLDYNLANAYYRSGKVGKAIANYERAFRRHSSDRDVIENLNLVSSKAGDPLLPSGALPSLLWQSFYALSINMLAAVTSVLWILICLGGSLFLVGRWPQAPRFAPWLIVFLFFGSWLGARVYLNEQPLAIVTASSADVRSGPNLSYPANFTVPEGHRVLLLGEQEPVTGWSEVGVPDQGLKGWLPETAVEKV